MWRWDIAPTMVKQMENAMENEKMGSQRFRLDGG